MEDLQYTPSVSGWAAQVEVTRPRRILVFDVEVPADITGPDVRRAVVPGLPIPEGTYTIWVDGGAAMLVARSGVPSTEPESARYDRIEDDHPLARARRWFDALWEGAEPLGQQAAFRRGDAVRLLGSASVGDVTAPGEWTGETYLYRVLVDGAVMTVSEAGLERLDLVGDDPRGWMEAPPADAADLSRLITITKLTNALSDTLYSYGSSKTIIRPYQFKPVLRLLGSPNKRLLIADEVGLGKTIEAGLVWTELEQRSEMRRVLVVCPAMLVRKWRDEMRRRFGRTVRIVDRTSMEELIDLFRHGDTQTQFYGVVSLERLRTSDQLVQLEAAGPTFDLVIVDEAHYLRNAATASYELGERLSDWADALLFLSATPLNLGQDDLFNLMNLLVPSEFPDKAVFGQQLAPNAVLTTAGRALRQHPHEPSRAKEALAELARMPFGIAVIERPEFAELEAILSRGQLSTFEQARAKRLMAELHTLSSVVNRTRRADVPDVKAKRTPIPIEVSWTEAEQRFYDVVKTWTYARARARGIPPGFAAQMPLRQTASCIPGMIRRLAELDEEEIEDDVDEGGVDQGGDAWDEAVVSDLRAELGGLAAGMRVDTKFERFREAIVDAVALGTGQVMVFSFFRRTLEYLASRLGSDFKCAVMHGGVPVAERERLMDRFRAGDIQVLLLSEVGSEGLDFEFCNVLFNYDLPWNPMRVEQRIGRVDRFGQRNERIFIYNFHVPGTIETDIFERLYERIRVFEESIGELEPVLRDEFSDLQRLVLDPTLSDAERSDELRRVDVAFHERAAQLDQLREAESELIGLDQLLVDGLERDIDRGRYIGRAELQSIVGTLLAAHPGSGLRPRADGDFDLIGTGDLASALQKSQRVAGASRYSLTELARLLSDGVPFEVTFDPEVASRTSRELLTVRHPLVLTAVDHVRAQPRTAAARFAACRIVGDNSGHYLVLISLLSVTGLRPALELWPVAVDLESGRVAEDVGDLLLGAIARGEASATEWDLPDMRPALATAVDHARGELVRTETERRLTNDALVAARMATVRAESDHKVRRAEQTLAKVASTGPQLRRLYEGRIRNLRAEEARRIDDLERKREFAAGIRSVAVVALEVVPSR